MGIKPLVFTLLASWQLLVGASPVENGEVIYMQGVDSNGNTIASVLSDLKSNEPLGCVNCHRESGFGSSESGQTFPPISWRFLGKNQPEDDDSRFYHIQNKRKAYDADSFYRMMTSGVNSNGKLADSLMPKYVLTRQQSDDLIAYLKTISPGNDPGVDGEEIRIATIVDKRLPTVQREQHIAFLQGLFEMKNGLSRGELKRKQFSPIQKVPQYQSFRLWKLVVWELSENPDNWASELEQYYRQQTVFTVMRPIVRDSYASVAGFCTQHEIPCFFPSGNDLPGGDFYNFVFRDRLKQSADYLAGLRRTEEASLFYIDQNSQIKKLDDTLNQLPYVSSYSASGLQSQYEKICATAGRLLVNAPLEVLAALQQLSCPAKPGLQLTAMSNDVLDYQAIMDFNRRNKTSGICWATDYDRVLKRNLRQVRVNAMVQRFHIQAPDFEELAKTLLNYGLLTDTLHKMAGNFTRVYMMEIIEHMLNSFPNYTYFSSITGAPYQRHLATPLNDYCASGEAS